MDKYTVLTFIGLAIFLLINLINAFVCEIPMMIDAIVSIIAAGIMILGLHYRKRK